MYNIRALTLNFGGQMDTEIKICTGTMFHCLHKSKLKVAQGFFALVSVKLISSKISWTLRIPKKVF